MMRNAVTVLQLFGGATVRRALMHRTKRSDGWAAYVRHCAELSTIYMNVTKLISFPLPLVLLV